MTLWTVQCKKQSNHENPQKERGESKRDMKHDEKIRTQDNKRRRLQLLATEQMLAEMSRLGCLCGPRRKVLNRTLTALEFGWSIIRAGSQQRALCVSQWPRVR